MGCLGSKDKEPAKTQTTQPQTTQKSDPTPSKSPKGNDKPPEVTDFYTIGEELGRGAFSIVKKGKNKKTGQHVAIKTIDKKFVEKTGLDTFGTRNRNHEESKSSKCPEII